MLRQLASELEHLDRLTCRAELLQRPALARERPYLELRRSELCDLRPCRAEALDRLVVAVRLGERLGPRQQRLDPIADVEGDAVEKELRIDAELLGEPGDGLVRRSCLPALDLADVLLGEAIAGECGLRQAGGDTQRAQALADPARADARSVLCRGGRIAHAGRTQADVPRVAVPRRGESLWIAYG